MLSRPSNARLIQLGELRMSRIAVQTATLAQALADPAQFNLTPDHIARLQAHAPDAIIWAQDDSGAASASLWWSHTPALNNQTTAYIGHYHATSSGSAQALLQAALDFLRTQKIHTAIGPIDGNTWRKYRLLTNRLTQPLFFLEPDNPDTYPGHFTAAGFEPLARYSSRITDQLDYSDPRLDSARARLAASGCIITPLTSHDQARRALPEIHALSLESFKNNFLYTPIAQEEFIAAYERILPAVDPRLVLAARRNGILEGYSFSIPDRLCPTPGQRMILKTVAIRASRANAGLGVLLVDLSHAAARALGYRQAIHALMHDDNNSRNISGRNSALLREYTLFARYL
jgi:hypothetical protein